MVTEAICAPSILEKWTNSPLVSTIAIFIFQLCFLASASAAAIASFARSRPIETPYGMSKGVPSAVPPAAGAAGGAAGAGAWAKSGVQRAMVAQVANVIETIRRINSSQLMLIQPGTQNLIADIVCAADGILSWKIKDLQSFHAESSARIARMGNRD